ncbi:DUF3784 domain-containing protein [Amedibacillus sp. YH-ame10]
MALMWILVVVFAIMTVMFYMGKGAFLIAGYNTSSQEEKNKIDEKKLCHVVGNGTCVITLTILAQILLEDVLPVWFFMAVMAIDIVYILVAGNTRCKRDSSEPLPETNTKSKKISITVSIIIGVSTLLIVAFFLMSGNVSIEVTDTNLIAKASLVESKKVKFSDIKKIELKENLDLGSRKNGLGDFKVSAGHFKNDAYGRYMLYSFNDCKTYIVLTLKDHSILVVNEKTEKETKQLYNTLEKRIP